MASEEISFSPWLSSSRTTFETICSMRSGSTGRLRTAICTERISLSRSNGTRRPLRLMTVSSRSCTRSKVVKRKLQERQTRRRRITAESSVGRESLTWVSRLPQLGQRMLPPRAGSGGVDGEAGGEPLHLLAHGGFGARILLCAPLRQGLEHFGDHLADLAELGDPEAPGRAGRRAEPDAGCDGRLLGVERNAVLVARDMGASERRF